MLYHGVVIKLTDRKSIEVILLRCIYDTHTSIDLLYYNLVCSL